LPPLLEVYRISILCEGSTEVVETLFVIETVSCTRYELRLRQHRAYTAVCNQHGSIPLCEIDCWFTMKEAVEQRANIVATLHLAGII